MLPLKDCGIDIPDKVKKYNLFFNYKPDHDLESRLERINLSKGKFRKSLIPIVKTIEKKRYKAGTYGLVFHDFTVIVYVHNKEKEIKIITFLKSHWRNNMENLKVDYKVYVKGWFK
jgi:hypothetical protein